MFIRKLFIINKVVSSIKAYKAPQLKSNSNRSLNEINQNVYRLNNEKRLIKDLFQNYQVKFGRPVNNMSEKIVVYFGVYLIQLIDLV